jgi:hypothetical protein
MVRIDWNGERINMKDPRNEFEESGSEDDPSMVDSEVKLWKALLSLCHGRHGFGRWHNEQEWKLF